MSPRLPQSVRACSRRACVALWLLLSASLPAAAQTYSYDAVAATTGWVRNASVSCNFPNRADLRLGKDQAYDERVYFTFDLGSVVRPPNATLQSLQLVFTVAGAPAAMSVDVWNMAAYSPATACASRYADAGSGSRFSLSTTSLGSAGTKWVTLNTAARTEFENSFGSQWTIGLSPTSGTATLPFVELAGPLASSGRPYLHAVWTAGSAPGPFSLSSPQDGQTFVANTSVVTLQWASSARADYYEVFAGEGAVPPTTNPIVVNSALSTTLSVANGKAYAWTVKARNIYGSTTASSAPRRFAVAVQTSPLDVAITNVDGSPRPGAICDLYGASGTSIGPTVADSTGHCYWPGLPTGTNYVVEARYDGAVPAFPGPEYWLRSTPLTVPASVTLARNQPWASGFTLRKSTAAGQVIPVGATVSAGDIVWTGVTVTQSTGATTSSRVRVLLDRDQSAPYDVDCLGSIPSQQVPSGGQIVFECSAALTLPGNYYRSLQVETLSASNGWTKTDSWAWNSVFTVTGQANRPPTLTLESLTGPTVEAGQQYQVVVTARDADANLTTVEIDWHDGTVDHRPIGGDQHTAVFSHVTGSPKNVWWSVTAQDATSASSGPLEGSFNVYSRSGGGAQIDGMALKKSPSGAIVDFSDVYIRRLNGSPITSNVRTWILIHGRGSTSSASDPIGQLAAIVASLQPNDQVLMVDWRSGASYGTSLFDDVLDFTGEGWIQPVAEWAASVLANLGLQGNQINLIGHSWGANLSDELAERMPFAGGPQRKVNSLIALDPADNPIPPARGDAYNPNVDVDFAAHSTCSLAIKSTVIAGSELTPTKAHAAFVLDFEGAQGITRAHSLAQPWFGYVIRDSASSVGRYFQLDRLTSCQPGPWEADWFDSTGSNMRGIVDQAVFGYEGRLLATDKAYPTAIQFEWGPSPFLTTLASSGASAVAGQPYHLEFEVEDHGGDLARIGVDWHDGTPVEYISASGALANVPFSRTFTGSQPRQWSAVAEDAQGHLSNTLSGSFTVTTSDASGPNVSVSSHVTGAVVTTASIVLTGSASDGARGDSGIQQVVVNGLVAAGGAAIGGSPANWSVTLPLAPGPNAITVTAFDDSPDHNANAVTLDVTRELLDTTSPSLSITSAVEGQIVTSANLVVSGAASDAGWGDSGIQHVSVNGITASGGAAVGSGIAAWTAVVPLVAGVNVLTAIASDDSPNHNATTVARTVIFQPQDLTAPRVWVDSPANGAVVATPTVLLRGTATDGARGDSGIQQVSVNGVRAANDTAAGAGQAAWTASVPLAVGTNQLTIVATDGSPAHNARTHVFTVTYQPTDSTGPNVAVTSHFDSQTVTTNSIMLVGTASDSGHGDSGISAVTVNGVPASNAAASAGATSTWSVMVPLQAGSNVLVVVASDDSPSRNSTTFTLAVTLASSGGCSYSLSPTASGVLSGAGSSGNFAVTTTAGCGWTAVPSDLSWLRIDSPAEVFGADWAQSTPSGGAPAARNQVASQYDAATDRLIVMGGNNYGTLLNDVWVLANATQPGAAATWAPVAATGATPVVRQGHVSGYDPATNRLIVHGGWPGLKDTWVLTHANGLGGPSQWTQLPDAPLDRADATAAYDAASNRLIVFGGLDVNYYLTEGWYNDVWVLRDANGIGTPTWEALQPTGTPPPARYYAASAYDPATNRLIVFGGVGQTGLLNDLWVLTNANGLGGPPQWLQIQGAGPSPRAGHHLGYDPATKRAWLVGGEENAAVRPTDGWVLQHADGSTAPPVWSQATLSGGDFGGNSVAAFGFAPATSRVVLALGVIGGQYRQDVWTASLAAGATSSGSGTVAFTVAPNPGTTPRTGNITVAGQTYAITQAGFSCGYTINPVTTGTVGAAGSSGYFYLYSSPGCGWAASSDASWVTLTPPSSGQGSATINYLVGANPSSSARSAHISVGGETFLVHQAGASCVFTFAASPTAFAAQGGHGSGVVTTAPADCSWSAASNAPWITFSGASSGVGSATIDFDIAVNVSTTARSGALTVGGQTLSITQDGRLITLVVTKIGSGSGAVVSGPAGLDCGTSCVATFPAGTLVTLTHIADPGSSFQSWGGDADCNDGIVTLSADIQCTAHFAVDVVGDAIPTISTVSPSAVVPGAAGLILSVSGTNFHPGATVRWNGVDHVPTSITATHAIAVIDANELAPGTASVTVRTPGGAVSNAASVQVAAPSGGLEFTASNAATGMEPVGVTVADLNADGRPDVVAANLASATVSVSLGNGDGSFGQRTDFPTGPGPSSVFVTDVNRDGRSDIITTNFVGNSVSVMIGNGDGSLAAPVHLPVGLGPMAVTTGDFDADGAPDLVVANNGSMNFSVLLGYGDGTFSGAVHYATAGPPQGIAALDFNADGVLDIITAGATGAVTACAGTGAGTFAGCSTVATGNGSRGLVAGDLNADGLPDIATANEFADSVSVLFGNAGGLYGQKLDLAVGSGPRALAMGDVNADAALDIIVTNSASGSVSVVFGNGDGTFRPRRDFPVGPGPVSVVAADFDRDGRLDIAVANQPVHAVSVLLGKLPAAISSVPSADFGPRATGVPTPQRPITMTNSGGVPLDVTTVLIASGAVSEFDIVSETCTAASVPPNGSCSINVRYLATTPGVQNATLEVGSNAIGAPHHVSLSGQSVPAATVTGFSPASGPPGTQVNIDGTSLTGASAVTFNGVAATFTVVSSTSITAAVPANATSGSILVVTPLNDVTTTAQFQVAPRIDGWSVSAGPVGTVVNVSGANFLPTANVIKFGPGYVRNIDSPDGMSLSFTVPDGLDLCHPAATVLCPGAYRAVRPGDYPFLVMSGTEVSNSAVFTVTP